MRDAHESVQQRVRAILRNLARDRAARLGGPRSASETITKVTEALSAEYRSKVARDIAFHVSDWNSDAAFVVVLHLFPEQFTKEEVAAGVVQLLIHAPNHLAAAAKLVGHPVEDVFEVGAIETGGSSKVRRAGKPLRQDRSGSQGRRGAPTSRKKGGSKPESRRRR